MFRSTYLDDGDACHECQVCGAEMWFAERLKGVKKNEMPQFGICCCNGKIIVPLLRRPPKELEELFFNKHSMQSKFFLKNIRTSKPPLHWKSITPQGNPPVYAQLYIYDTENEISNRMSTARSELNQRIDELHMAYLPLQYPLLFPYGDNGYDSSNQHALESLSATKKKKKLTPREYLAFRLMRRKSETSVILHGNKLRKFIVDGYSMVESDRLDYIRKHQKELRVDLYSGITDALTRGETDPSSTWRRVILPSSFTVAHDT
ncbi:hypothetical protein K1719_028862 [Acacia pycnantha]|nr:hypothetical protein K1719_028862 [Acacia pycnantha]